MTGVWNTTFQNALQSMSRIRFRHQSGPPPCSAPQISVPALLESWLAGPLTLAEPVAASASAASTTPAKSQSLRRCIYSLRSFYDDAAASTYFRPNPLLRGGPHSDRQKDAIEGPFVRGAPWGLSLSPVPIGQPVKASGSAGQGVRPRNHFEDLLGDLGLAGAVHGEGQVVDQVAGVLRRVPHRRHLGAVLGGGRLEQRAVELRLDVDGEQPLEDLLGLGLEDEVAPEGVLVSLLLGCLEQRPREGEQLLLRLLLRQRGLEAVVDDEDAVDLLLRVQLDHLVGDRLRIGVARV